MFKETFEALILELEKGIHTKGHPFRYFTLGTINSTNEPKLRTVVLRELNSDLKVVFYTDNRSPKVSQLQANDKVSALFYHPDKLIQIIIQGKTTVITNQEVLEPYWNKVLPHARKDYTSMLAPSTLLDNKKTIQYKQENHFSIIEITPYTIEVLDLKKPNHQRVLFQKENKKWNGKLLVP